MFRFSAGANQAHLVSWREWGYEAFQEAREQGKPLALFLTAFWCGFCQRMDEGALSDPEAIALLNAFLVPVRVEESQRPDVDLRYNQDGWPTIAFLNPDGDHLFSVNYMDPDPFVELLVRVVQLHQQGDLLRGESEAPDSQPLREPDPAAEGGHTLGPALFYEVLGLVEGLADPVHGGFGDGFKFLHTDAHDFFLYVYQATGERQYLDHVLLTLTKLRAGPMFDAPLGGFFRYSSKPDWSEPHREKLLYDQAALLRNYLHAYLLTGEAEWRVHAEGIIEFVESYLFDEEAGAYLGCQDYVAFDSPVPAEATHRQTRPVVDELVYCDANAAMVSACLDAWWLLGRVVCRERAERVLETLWRRLRAQDGRMFHYWEGNRDTGGKSLGLLVDSVETGLALLDAYAILGGEVYLQRAEQLANAIRQWHLLPDGGIADISQAGPGRLSTPVGVMPQNARAALFFLRLSAIGGEMGNRETAGRALARFTGSHSIHGAFASGFGHAVGRLLAEPELVTVTGVPGSTQTRESARAVLTQPGRGNVTLLFRQET